MIPCFVYARLRVLCPAHVSGVPLDITSTAAAAATAWCPRPCALGSPAGSCERGPVTRTPSDGRGTSAPGRRCPRVRGGGPLPSAGWPPARARAQRAGVRLCRLCAASPPGNLTWWQLPWPCNAVFNVAPTHGRARPPAGLSICPAALPYTLLLVRLAVPPLARLPLPCGEAAPRRCRQRRPQASRPLRAAGRGRPPDVPARLSTRASARPAARHAHAPNLLPPQSSPKHRPTLPVATPQKAKRHAPLDLLRTVRHHRAPPLGTTLGPTGHARHRASRPPRAAL